MSPAGVEPIGKITGKQGISQNRGAKSGAVCRGAKSAVCSEDADHNHTEPELIPVESKEMTQIQDLDIDLQLVINTWSTLPNAIKAGIMAMIRAI